MYVRLNILWLLFWCGSVLQSQNPMPTSQQLNWHNMEFYLFVHFGPNTFSDVEWGHGHEDTNIFYPAQLDCNQWCRTAVAAGAKGIIITAKHHDGFCLWPSKYSSHTVAFSKWNNGRGDVLKELSDACKKHGLKFGVYISPWDRNHPDYGSPGYNDIFIAMMNELFDNYGPIWELWWDGANGEGPDGKMQVYDWDRFKAFVRKKSPETLIFSDVGPDIRWVGNEKGIAGKTHWYTLHTDGFTPGLGAPPSDTLNIGNRYGSYYIPAECDVSIRPGWFYHSSEDTKVKSPAELFDLYLKSVGRGANLLLNVPPDRNGRFHKIDSTNLVNFKKLLDNNFKNNILSSASVSLVNDLGKTLPVTMPELDALSKSFFGPDGKRKIKIDLNKSAGINCVVIQENLTMGQQIREGKLNCIDMDGKVLNEIHLTSVGHKRMVTFPAMEVSTITFEILHSDGNPGIREISAFYISENRIENE